MAVRKETQEGLERAAKIREEIYGAGKPKEEEPTPPQSPPPTPEPEPSPPPEQDAPPTPVEPTPAEPPIDQPAEPPAEPAPEPEPTPAPDARIVELEAELAEARQQLEKGDQRYRTLQGKYNHETRRMNERIAALEEKAEKATAPPQAPPAEPPKAAPTPPADDLIDIRSILTKEEIGEWGEEMIEVMNKISRANAKIIADQHMAPINERIGKIDELENAQRTTIRSHFDMQMDQLVPDWEEINETDEGFKEWLAEPDGLSGATRYENASMLLSNLDAEGLARYFQQYKTEKTAKPSSPAPQRTPETPPAPPAPQEKPKAPPQPPVSPSRGHQAPVDLYAEPTKEAVVTREDLQDAIAQMRAGKLSLEEYQKLREKFAADNLR